MGTATYLRLLSRAPPKLYGSYLGGGVPCAWCQAKDKTQLHPTPAILAAADALEESLRRFLAAQDMLPPPGEWEALDEAYLMLALAIRNSQGVITLARQDLLLLPGAMVMARVAFETGVTVRWMLDPDDPFDRELRWLRTLKTRE